MADLDLDGLEVAVASLPEWVFDVQVLNFLKREGFVVELIFDDKPKPLVYVHSID